jgi:hypothetical protein
MVFMAGLLIGMFTGILAWLAVAAWLESVRVRFATHNLTHEDYCALANGDFIGESPYSLSRRIAQAIQD